jgi:hypothetical protein
MFKWFPKEYLRIIHDKMDKTKTSIPRLCVKSKSIVGTNLGFSLIGMITHGHKKEVLVISPYHLYIWDHNLPLHPLLSS